MLEFDEVVVCVDYSKSQIIERLRYIERHAIQFEKERKKKRDKSLLCIAVFWIGHKLSYDNEKHIQIRKKLRIQTPASGTDGSEYYDVYAVTRHGELLNFSEYLTLPAQFQSTHVVFF